MCTKPHQQFRPAPLLAGLAAALAACALTPATAAQFSTVSGHYITAPGFSVGSTTAPASYGNYSVVPLSVPGVPFSYDVTGPTTTHQAGIADAASLTTKAYTHLLHSGDANVGIKTASIDAGVSNVLHVRAGQSGLQHGDAVTLSLTLSLDGVMQAGTNNTRRDVHGNPIPDDGNWAFTDHEFGSRQLSSVELSSYFRIEDPNNQICGEGCYPETVLQFGAGGRLEVDSMSWNRVLTTEGGQWWIDHYDPTHDGYTTEVLDVGWNYFSNNGATDSFSTRIENDIAQSTFNPFYNKAYQFDTGTLTISFNSYIGADLDVSANLGMFLQANGDHLSSLAQGDFMHTFAANVTSNTVGVDVFVEAAPVPEPETYALMLLGLGAVGWATRWRRG